MRTRIGVQWTCWALAVLALETAGTNLRSASWNGGNGEKSSGDTSPLLADAGSIMNDAQEEQACSFELYDPQADVLRIMDPGPDGVVFHQGTVYVVDGTAKDDGSYQRYLTFEQGNAGSGDSSAFNNFFGGDAMQKLARPMCREQVQVTCQARKAPQAGTALITEGSGCDAKLCKPNVRENMVPEYRVLLGSALSGRVNLGRISVLGFGAGIIPAALAASHPEASVEAVDISGDVLAAARCFGIEPSDKMKLVEGDARAYMEGVEDGSLDMLFVDIYDDKANIPPCFTTSEFFQLAKSKLSKDGTLAMNIVTKQLQDVVPSVMASFANVKLGSLNGNRGNNVLLASVGSGTSLLQGLGVNAGAGESSGSSQEADNGFAPVFSSWAQDGTFSSASQGISGAPRSDADVCK